MIKSILVFFIFSVMVGCSGLKRSQQEKLRQVNTEKEVIFRNQSDQHYPIESPILRQREAYPWEDSCLSKYPKITKEFFRCKGSHLHLPKNKTEEEKLYDCGGVLKHSLPVKEGKEFIYPILLDLLNYIQKETDHRVVITCGHRCPVHNLYADHTVFNTTSKHMIGAEVDFYVEGMEHSIDQIIQIIFQFYSKQSPYRFFKEYTQFQQLDLHLTNVVTPPWYNKEILIKVYQEKEGRDEDNQHSYPYLSLQVRFDSQTNEKVVYSWEKAFRGFLRY